VRVNPRFDDFSLMRGGPTWRALQPLTRLFPGIRPASWIVVILLLLLTIVPPAVLTWSAGTLLPGSVARPFAGDWFVLSRLLFAMPLLVLAARFSDRMVSHAVRQLSGSGVVAEQSRPQFERILATALRARDGYAAELTCLVLAFAPALMIWFAFSAMAVGPAQDSWWRFDATGQPSAAAVWLEFVAAPLFRFVLLLWLWRFAMWTWMLWRLSRLPLALRATHPDHACGLAFLGLAQSRFAVLSAAGAIVLCGNGINQMLYDDAKIASFQYEILAYVIAATTLLLGPLLLLSISLARTKVLDMARYDAMGQRLVQAFDAQWEDMPAPAMLDCPSPQTMADFSSVHENIRATAVVPLNRWHLARMLAAALLPFAPLLFISMSLDELLGRMLSVLV
jgi:hypothetical protein